jgi:hypothetical protein
LDAEKGSMPDWLSIDGYFKISSVYSYLSHDAAGTDFNWQGLTRLRSELKLKLDADLPENWQARVSGHGFYDFAYTINGRDNFTDDVLDHYEKELEFDEVYLQESLTNDLDLKADRQIVVWGRLDNIRITDVLNPLDLRWPGLVDIEKLRLPVTMTKLDYYIKHPRIKMVGGAFNMAQDNWLFKTEAAYFHGFEFSNTPDKEYCRLDGLAGVE